MRILSNMCWCAYVARACGVGWAESRSGPRSHHPRMLRAQTHETWWGVDRRIRSEATSIPKDTRDPMAHQDVNCREILRAACAWSATRKWSRNACPSHGARWMSIATCGFSVHACSASPTVFARLFSHRHYMIKSMPSSNSHRISLRARRKLDARKAQF
jgi:hypothetical protein